MTQASTRPRILIVEDELAILTGLSMNLRFEGYEVMQAQDGRSGLKKAVDERPDLIVLDIMLPELNGFEVIKALRDRGVLTPVLVLSAKGLEADKVLGLTVGADDYLVKPFGLPELLARVKALLRRHTASLELVRVGDVDIDLRAKTAKRDGKDLDLTAQELKLLLHFALHMGRSLSREELLGAAWGYDYEGTARTVDNFVSHLRAKLEPDPEQPRHLVTVRGQGYRLDP